MFEKNMEFFKPSRLKNRYHQHKVTLFRHHKTSYKKWTGLDIITSYHMDKSPLP